MAFDQRDLYQRENDVQRDAANAGGPAAAFASVNTTGAGSFVIKKRIDFGLTFIQQPFPAYCAEVDLDDAEDVFGDDAPPLPQCTGFVTRWDLDDHDHFVGCWVAVRVDYPTDVGEGGSGDLALVHYFTFQAVAIKDLSDSPDDAELSPGS